ncbi:MAG: hypothetical protein AB7F66_11080 [Bacteriovoracia bacterium]
MKKMILMILIPVLVSACGPEPIQPRITPKPNTQSNSDQGTGVRTDLLRIDMSYQSGNMEHSFSMNLMDTGKRKYRLAVPMASKSDLSVAPAIVIYGPMVNQVTMSFDVPKEYRGGKTSDVYPYIALKNGEFIQALRATNIWSEWSDNKKVVGLDVNGLSGRASREALVGEAVLCVIVNDPVMGDYFYVEVPLRQKDVRHD